MHLHPEGPSSARRLRALLRPEIIVRAVIRRFSLGSLEFRLAMQALNRLEYAFGVRQAVWLAKRLGHHSVSVVEFGVAGGSGLLEMENYALEFGRQAGITVEVYGFDLGEGLPAPSEYRDLGYFWQKGAYKMDADSLRKKLRVAKLLLGEVGETVPKFNATPHAPVGFVSFDLDFYSSTTSAFGIFDCPDDNVLPRVFTYFDDIVTDGHQIHCDDVGELLAIKEFNERSDGSFRLAAPPVLKIGTVFPALWEQQLRVYHRFHHVDYNRYIGD